MTNLGDAARGDSVGRKDQKQQFLELLKNCHGRLRAVARSYAAADAEDLFQEILLQI